MAIDTTGWTMREVAHLNGGAAWFGYIFQCVQEPRLERIDRYYRKDRSTKSTWRVGNVEHPDLDSAIAALEPSHG